MQSTSRRESWCSRRSPPQKAGMSTKIFNTPTHYPSTQKKTSSRHIRIDSKELAGSQGRITSPYAVMLNPVVHAPRKCPIAMRPLVREKLDEFLEQGIITPVEEPTDWVSSLAYSWKANGKLRVCLDPRDVNKAIKRDHYKTPTVEEITHLLAGSKKFTKVDGTSSYLCIVLDYESSLLTTFNTPWGRYRFVRLPWGLSCAQDIFQRMMDQILE